MLIDQEWIYKVFEKTGAMLTGHFLLTSGRHSDRYIQCMQVLQYPKYTEMLCRELAERFMGEKITAVVGPALGGLFISYEMARALNARGLFAERGEDGRMTLRRGFYIDPGEKVLVVEDVITTGVSIVEVIELIRKAGGEVVGAGSLVNRSGGSVRLDVPRQESLLHLSAASYEARECPLCSQGIPCIKPGSRKISIPTV